MRRDWDRRLVLVFDLLTSCLIMHTYITVEIRSPAQAARQIDHAIGTALTQRKPVYIEVAWCVLCILCRNRPNSAQSLTNPPKPHASNIAQEPLAPPIPFQLTPLHFRPPSNAASLDAAVDAIVTVWQRAARPVIVVGGKVRDQVCEPIARCSMFNDAVLVIHRIVYSRSAPPTRSTRPGPLPKRRAAPWR